MAATQKKSSSTRTAAKKPAAKAPATKAKAGTAKKTAAKKPATKTAASKKTAAKKTATKASTSRSTAKKPAARATATKAKASTAKKTTAKKPARKKSPFSPAFLAKQHQALLDERERYLGQAEALQQEADQLAADREPGDVQFDEESGEGDTIAVERERDLTLSAQAREAVRQIDEALERMERGEYGICVHSGQPIPKARLEAIPWAAERVEYKVAKLGS